MKTYVLMVSRYFPKGYSKELRPTEFVYKVENGIGVYDHLDHLGGKDEPEDKKLHTIRGNYNLWAKRFDEINAGKAYLSLRYWEGKPYHSKQVEFAELTKDDGIGLQKLQFDTDRDGCVNYKWFKIDNKVNVNIETLANNDGLTLADWKDWFNGYDLSKPMAIIHFTNFRY